MPQDAEADIPRLRVPQQDDGYQSLLEATAKNDCVSSRADSRQLSRPGCDPMDRMQIKSFVFIKQAHGTSVCAESLLGLLSAIPLGAKGARRERQAAGTLGR